MPDDSFSNDDVGKIPTNLRLLMVLEELCRAGVPITPTDVNATLKLPKPTVHRLFHTLEAEGFIQRDIDGRSYSPGARLRRMSMDALSSLRIRTARLAVLTALAEEVGETCNIAIPEREEMIYLDRVETKWPLRIQLPVGTTVPFHCTASGKMYLSTFRPSHLQTFLTATKLKPLTHATITDAGKLAKEVSVVAERGYATDNEEFMEGMVAVAVAIRDTHDRLLATLSIHAPTQRVSLDELVGFVPLISKSARMLSALLAEDDHA
ncbi:IclR family transcriptional regulator [bacterium]|nr:IclR family transcriptional regulator [bacterium]